MRVLLMRRDETHGTGWKFGLLQLLLVKTDKTLGWRLFLVRVSVWYWSILRSFLTLFPRFLRLIANEWTSLLYEVSHWFLPFPFFHQASLAQWSIAHGAYRTPPTQQTLIPVDLLYVVLQLYQLPAWCLLPWRWCLSAFTVNWWLTQARLA